GRCSSPRPKKRSTSECVCVPFCHSHIARQRKLAASGAAVSASRAPSSASTLTPLSTGVSVAVIVQLLSYVFEECHRGHSKRLSSATDTALGPSPCQVGQNGTGRAEEGGHGHWHDINGRFGRAALPSCE